MFDFGSGELVVIGVVALVAIGPKELPGLLRTVGQAVAKLRRMAGDFQNQFNEAMREADMADAQKMISDIKSDFSTTMTGSGAMSPPIVMPSTEETTQVNAGEGAVQSDQPFSIEPVAEPEPVTGLTAHDETHEPSSAPVVHEETAPKSQAGAA